MAEEILLSINKGEAVLEEEEGQENFSIKQEVAEGSQRTPRSSPRKGNAVKRVIYGYSIGGHLPFMINIHNLITIY